MAPDDGTRCRLGPAAATVTVMDKLKMLETRKLRKSLMWWLTSTAAELPCCIAAGPDSSEIDTGCYIVTFHCHQPWVYKVNYGTAHPQMKEVAKWQ